VCDLIVALDSTHVSPEQYLLICAACLNRSPFAVQQFLARLDRAFMGMDVLQTTQKSVDRLA